MPYIKHECVHVDPQLGAMLARRLIYVDPPKKRWCVLEANIIAACFNPTWMKWEEVIASGYEYDSSPASQSAAYSWCHSADAMEVPQYG